MGSTLYLIRHGQASFGAANYDVLSDLGREQARALGKWWDVEKNPLPKMFHGTLERQKDTFLEMSSTYSGGLPSPTVIAEMNEHEGTEVYKMYQDQYPRSKDPKENMRMFFRMNKRWIDGELDSGPHESWEGFLARTKRGFEQVYEALEEHPAVGVVTSGGVIARGIGLALGLEGIKIMELNWQIRNSSVNILRYSNGKLYLRDFNMISHLEEKQITYV